MRRCVVLALLLAASCRPAGPNAATARAAMDSLLAAGRRAHLETNAELLAASLADALLSIADGAVTASPKDSLRAMGRYFSGASYRAWDDVEPPRILISDDNSLAWVCRVVCVDREEPAPEGGRRRRLFVSAYTATYKWKEDGWRMTTVTSTFLPDPPTICPPRAHDERSSTPGS
jgi:hypothetical protein